MTPDPEDTLIFPVVAEDTETLPALPAVTEPVPAQAPEPPKSPAEEPLPIGDALVAEMPGFDILPCGRCGTRYDGAPSDVLRFDRILGPLTVMARQAGWACDGSLVWCCPGCLAGAERAGLGEADPWYDYDGRAEALRAHLELLREFDREASRIMGAFEGGTWEPGKWRYEEAAPAAWAA